MNEPFSKIFIRVLEKKNSENLFKMITNRQVLDQIVEWLAPKRNTVGFAFDGYNIHFASAMFWQRGFTAKA